MNRKLIYFLIDSVTLAALFGMMGTGLILKFAIPRGWNGEDTTGLMLWNHTRDEWGGIHFYFAIALICIIVLHVAMHWSWIWTTVASWIHRGHSDERPSSATVRNLAGAIALGIALLVVTTFIGFAASHVNGVTERTLELRHKPTSILRAAAFTPPDSKPHPNAKQR